MTTRRAGWRSRAERRSDEQGVTLVELMVAITVLAFVLAAVAVGTGGALSLTRNNRNRSIAANLAALEMDRVRSTDFETLPLGTVTSTRLIDNVDYSIQRDTQWVSKSASSGACDSPAGSQPAYLRVTVEVTWPNMAGAQPVQSSTIISPPVGSYDNTAGHLAVKVLDRKAKASSGHTVSIVGPGGTTTTQTVVRGCAFFAYIAPGSYTVTLTGKTAGYVDPNGVASPQQTATVSARSVTSLQFDYDKAATLVLTLGQDSTYPVPNTIPLTLGNARFPIGTKTFSGSGRTRTITGLFPFVDGYEAWAGDCEGADPEGQDSDGSLIYDGGQRQPPYPANPGATTTSSTNVVMERVQVKAVKSSGVVVGGATVTASHPASDGCPATTLTLGTTDSAGVLKASMPYGSWTFTINGRTQTVVLDPTNTDPTIVTVTVP